MSESHWEAYGRHTSDRSGPQCREASRESVSATVRRGFPATIGTERSTRPSADRKRSHSISRVVQRVIGASGGQDLQSRCAAEHRAIRILSRMCREMTIPHRRTAEDGAAMRADPDLAMAASGLCGTLPDRTPNRWHRPCRVESPRSPANASCHARVRLHHRGRRIRWWRARDASE